MDNPDLIAGAPKDEEHRCSLYRGVTWCRSESMWRTRIFVNSKQLHIGRYETEEAAAEAYDCAALARRSRRPAWPCRAVAPGVV
ncbi:MAG: hypothetical protein J3K34DRAFT_426959 [Monoraphidium minutum]|nr:MAG: hypothetical protein J3K34DRAFT_426959 [Monoraphidium minutum]